MIRLYFVVVVDVVDVVAAQSSQVVASTLLFFIVSLDRSFLFLVRLDLNKTSST